LSCRGNTEGCNRIATAGDYLKLVVAIKLNGVAGETQWSQPDNVTSILRLHAVQTK